MKILFLILVLGFSFSFGRNYRPKTYIQANTRTSLDSSNVLIDDRELFVKFPGGENKLKKFITKNLKYPQSAIKDRIEGVTYVRFLIDENGKVFNIEVVKGLSTDIDKESVRVVSIMPDWIWDKKIKKNQRKVTQRILPLVFKLN